MGNHPESTPARTPSDEERQAEVEEAFELQQGLKKARRIANEAGLELARWCYVCNEAMVWHKVEQDISKEAWLADPEISMNRRTFDRFAYLWRETQVLRQIPATTVGHIEPTKLEIAIQAVNKGRAPLAQAISDADMLSKRGLLEKYVDPYVNQSGGIQPPVADSHQSSGDGQTSPHDAPDPDDPDETPPEPSRGDALAQEALDSIPPTTEGIEPPQEPENAPEVHAAYRLLQHGCGNRWWLEGDEDEPEACRACMTEPFIWQTILEVDV